MFNKGEGIMHGFCYRRTYLQTQQVSDLTASTSKIPTFEKDELACLNPQIEKIHVFTLSSVNNAHFRTNGYNKRG